MVMRAVARAARESQREARRIERENARWEKAQERRSRENERLRKQEYYANRNNQAEEITANNTKTVEELQSLLRHALGRYYAIDFDSLRLREPLPQFSPTISFQEKRPKPPNIIAKLWPWSQRNYEKASAGYNLRKNEFEHLILKQLEEHTHRVESLTEEARLRDEEVDEFRDGYFAKVKDAVENYNSMVIENSSYPDEFPREFKLAYIPESNELVIEYELPTADVVPVEEEAHYVKTRDEIVIKPRKSKDIKELYQDIVASVALKCIYELLQADKAKALDVVVFNGYVKTRNPASGRDIQPYLLSVRATKEQFSQLDLKYVEKLACLRNLGARVSASPQDMVPVKPVIEFDMIDKRFIAQQDILAELESRPNLMELTPSEFENLVSNLFGKLGLEAKLTQSSRDGGVDCVAFDNRPVLGGKVVIQAKRYSHTVGVSAVRDLYGTMQHEGANKGILVTTSGYGPDAFEFIKDKPIELIAGGQLLYLLSQVGIEARILFADDFKQSTIH